MSVTKGLITNKSASPVTALTMSVVGGTVGTAPASSLGAGTCTKFDVTPGVAPGTDTVYTFSYTWGGVTQSCTVRLPNLTGETNWMWVTPSGRLLVCTTLT